MSCNTVQLSVHMIPGRSELALLKQEHGKPGWPVSHMNAILKIYEYNIQYQAGCYLL